MGSVFLLICADLRRRWRGWLGAAVLLGLVLGLLGALIAGGRRTESAHKRFSERFRASDLTVADSNDFGFSRNLDLDRVGALPQVAESATATAVLGIVETEEGLAFAATLGVNPFAPHDERLGTVIDEFKILRGRAADPTNAAEAVIGFVPAEATGLDVGDVMRLKIPTNDAISQAIAGFLAGVTAHVAAGTSPPLEDLIGRLRTIDLDVEIVGVVATAGGFPPLPGTLSGILYLSPAVYASYGSELGGQDIHFTRLHADADRPAFLAELNRLSDGRAVAILASDENDANVQRALDLQAFWLFALGAALAIPGVAVCAQALARQLRGTAEARRIAGVLGMGASQLRGVVVGSVMPAVLGGIVVGAMVTVILSPLFPLGLARTAEPDPGLRFDTVAFAVLAGVGLVAGIAAVAVALVHRKTRVAPIAFPSWLPLNYRLGFTMATSSTATRRLTISAVGAVALAATLGVGVATFSWSVDHLRATPDAYGWSAHVQIGQHGLPELAAPVVAGLVQRADVTGISQGTVVRIEIDGVVVDALALEAAGRAPAPVKILDGHPPGSTDEIVVGGVTLEAIDASVGDTVSVTLGDVTRPMRIAGRGVFAKLGDAGQLGRGALIEFAALDEFEAVAPRNIVLVSLGGDRCCDEAAEKLRRSVAPLPSFVAAPPPELGGIAQADALPWLTAALIGAFAVAVLAHTALMVVRQQRRTVAVLRALGLTRPEVTKTLVVQTGFVAGAGLALGAVAGVAVGRVAWRTFTSSIGVDIGAAVQIVPLLVGSTVCMVVTTILSIWPARRLSAMQVSVTLRRE